MPSLKLFGLGAALVLGALVASDQWDGPESHLFWELLSPALHLSNKAPNLMSGAVFFLEGLKMRQN